MFKIKVYMRNLINSLTNSFQERLLYVGLQGSYMRGEATEDSDIDVMVILNGFQVGDLDTYKRLISEMDCSEKACGFICGKEEMEHWNPMEICHRYIHSDAEKNKRKLVDSYKNVFFILQNKYFLQTGVFAKTKKELIAQLKGRDEAVMRMALELEKSKNYEFYKAFELLFYWCQGIMAERC